MADKRRHKRYARRIRARYGETDLSRSGFVTDVSVSGLFVSTAQLPPIGTRLHVQLELTENKSVFVETLVTRYRSTQSALRAVESGGFGARFLDIRELVAEILPAIKDEILPPDVRFTVRYAAFAEVQIAFERELRHGGLFVTTEKSLPRDTPALITLELAFNAQSFSFPARVVQVSGGSTPGAVRGLGFLFDDKIAVITAVAPYLG